MWKQTAIAIALLVSTGSALLAARPWHRMAPKSATSSARLETPPRQSAPRVLLMPTASRAEAAASDAGREAPLGARGEEPPIKSHDEALFELQQRFEALKQERALELRNGRLLTGVFQRVGLGPDFGRSLACRGSECRVVLAFEDAEQMNKVLNGFGQDPAWKEANFGFNAIPETPDGTDRFVVYFTAPPPAE